MSRCETNSGDSWAGEDVSEGGVTGRYGTLLQSVSITFPYYLGPSVSLRAAGEAKPGPSEVCESCRANDPYGLLSSSSHMLEDDCARDFSLAPVMKSQREKSAVDPGAG